MFGYLPVHGQATETWQKAVKQEQELLRPVSVPFTFASTQSFHTLTNQSKGMYYYRQQKLQLPGFCLNFQ